MTDINVSLITISSFIFYKAVDRFLHPVAVKPQGIIIVAIVGLIVNLAGVCFGNFNVSLT